MSVLLLRLAAPMQSWGSQSRFRQRDTEAVPTKSGVLGLLAAASGRRRTDQIEDLHGLGFGVRVDQPGRLMTDFHTVHTQGSGKPPIITKRDYLCDAVFVAGVEGPETLVDALASAIDQPAFPLFLGRRSCPAEGRLNLGVVQADLVAALSAAPWQAAEHHRRRQPSAVRLRIVRDTHSGGGVTHEVHDNPISFDPRNRQYGWRRVEEGWCEVVNPEGRSDEGGLADWFESLGA